MVVRLGAVLVALTAAGVVAGAGTTAVAVQPDTAALDEGSETSVDIVVESADGGVGSIDLELALGDGAVADLTNVSVAGAPSTVDTSGDEDSVRIAATGMDTADTGSLTVATVTIAGQSGGTSTLDLTVSAIGDESGTAYDVSDTGGGDLTVEGAPDPTPTETPTDDGGGDGDSGNGGGSDVSYPAPTPTATTTVTETPEPTAEPTPTTTVTETPERGGAVPPSTATGTSQPVVDQPVDPSQSTATPAAPGDSSSVPVVPLVVGSVVVVLVAGLIYYRN